MQHLKLLTTQQKTLGNELAPHQVNNLHVQQETKTSAHVIPLGPGGFAECGPVDGTGWAATRLQRGAKKERHVGWLAPHCPQNGYGPAARQASPFLQLFLQMPWVLLATAAAAERGGNPGWAQHGGCAAQKHLSYPTCATDTRLVLKRGAAETASK